MEGHVADGKGQVRKAFALAGDKAKGFVPALEFLVLSDNADADALHSALPGQIQNKANESRANALAAVGGQHGQAVQVGSICSWKFHCHTANRFLFQICDKVALAASHVGLYPCWFAKGGMLGTVFAGEMELDGDVPVGLGNEAGEEWGGSKTGGEDLHGGDAYVVCI